MSEEHSKPVLVVAETTIQKHAMEGLKPGIHGSSHILIEEPFPTSQQQLSASIGLTEIMPLHVDEQPVVNSLVQKSEFFRYLAFGISTHIAFGFVRNLQVV